MRLIAIFLFVVPPLVFSTACAEMSLPGTQQGGINKLLDIEYTEISEMSGLVKSRRYDDVYWVHNDSGDSARIFAVNTAGKVIIPAYLRGDFYGEEVEEGKKIWPGLAIEQAANIDWEDIAVDDDNIYVSEMGNNGNARRDLGVYILPEPNPRQIDRSRAYRFIPIRYPDQIEFPARQWHYDCEGMFVFKGKLYFLTKHRQPGKINDWEPGTVLYRLDSMHTDKVNLLTRVDAHADVSLVTAADLSPDGEHLVILCYTQLWVFNKPRRGDRWLSRGTGTMIPLDLKFTRQAEAVAWMDNETILIGNEESEWFTVSLAEILGD